MHAWGPQALSMAGMVEFLLPRGKRQDVGAWGRPEAYERLSPHSTDGKTEALSG